MSKSFLRPAVETRSRSPRSRTLSRRLAAIALTAFLASGVGCSRDPGPNDYSSQLTITIQEGAPNLGNFGFSPNPASVAINTLVTWVNRDSIDHRVVSTGGFFDSGPIRPGQSYELIFRSTGTFRYHDESPGSQIQGVLNVVE